MINKQILNDLQQMNDIIEEREIREIPAFFIQMLYNGGSGSKSIIPDFLWWCKMMEIYNLQFSIKEYEECQKTLKKMQDRLGYYSYFNSMESELAKAERDTTYFIYNGRDDVTWNQIPLEIRKQDYPYYFDKEGNDCFPFIQK